eukprot:NODE_6_length_70510_cov_1.054395.p57 type:complete len:115 gc:universal NODE_6_length_70510_cov_1.054395:1217-873(-)
MGRNKIDSSQKIDDERKRQVSLSKRKKGLFKKAQELSSLAGVDVAVIIVNKNKTYQYSSREMDHILFEYSARKRLYDRALESSVPQNAGLPFPQNTQLNSNSTTDFWNYDFQCE